MRISEELKCDRRCVGACCRFALMPLRDEDHARWATYHGFVIYRIQETGEYRALFPIQCKFLTSEGKCSVYGTDKRPGMCDEFWCDQMPTYEKVNFDV